MYGHNGEQLRRRQGRPPRSPLGQSPNTSEWMTSSASPAAVAGGSPWRVNRESSSGVRTKKTLIHDWEKFSPRINFYQSEGSAGGSSNGSTARAISGRRGRTPDRREDTRNDSSSGVDIRSEGKFETPGDLSTLSSIRSSCYSYTSSAAMLGAQSPLPERTASPARMPKDGFHFRDTVRALLAAIFRCFAIPGHPVARTREAVQDSPSPSSVFVTAADMDKKVVTGSGCPTPGTRSRRYTLSWSAWKRRVDQSPTPVPPRSENSGVITENGILSKQSSVSHHQGNQSFTMDDILRATDNFSFSFVIGEGGSGTVYKGVLPDGKLVAIKRARKGLIHEHVTAEFFGEISILSQITHLNLVSFLGYVEHADERIIVVEYVPNGSLREHLDGIYGPLDFGARLTIANDVAHAVTYLHNHAGHPIIHRDIKSTNILLTKNLRAKVADFGFARVEGMEKSYVVTQVKGTTGYLDPEYLNTLQLTKKSDVYSFGVLLVELVSGRRPIERGRENNGRQRITVDWAMRKLRAGNSTDVLDPRIPKTSATENAVKMILELASRCLEHTKQRRPSMQQCGEILCCIRKDYLEEVHKLGYNFIVQSCTK